MRARDVLRVVRERDGLERTARVAVRGLPVAALLAQERLRAPQPCARERVVELVVRVHDRAQNLGGALRLARVDEHVREQNRVPKPLERVAAPLGVVERLLEHADGGLQIAQLRVGAPERVRDGERSLRVRLGGLLEERDGSARVADRVRDLAEAGERARSQRPIVRVERGGEQPLGLHRVAEAERDLRVQQRIVR